MGNLNKLFQKVTGLTWDLESVREAGKITDEKLAWLVPDGAMLENPDGRKRQAVDEFYEEANLSEELSKVEVETYDDEEETTGSGSNE